MGVTFLFVLNLVMIRSIPFSRNIFKFQLHRLPYNSSMNLIYSYSQRSQEEQIKDIKLIDDSSTVRKMVNTTEI